MAEGGKCNDPRLTVHQLLKITGISRRHTKKYNSKIPKMKEDTLDMKVTLEVDHVVELQLVVAAVNNCGIRPSGDTEKKWLKQLVHFF